MTNTVYVIPKNREARTSACRVYKGGQGLERP